MTSRVSTELAIPSMSGTMNTRNPASWGIRLSRKAADDAGGVCACNAEARHSNAGRTNGRIGSPVKFKFTEFTTEAQRAQRDLYRESRDIATSTISFRSSWGKQELCTVGTHRRTLFWKPDP